MAWQVDFGPRAERALKKLDRQVAARVVAYLEEMAAGDPRARRKALTGELGGFWRYPRRRLVGAVLDEDARLVILVVDLGHRREVYR